MDDNTQYDNNMAAWVWPIRWLTEAEFIELYPPCPVCPQCEEDGPAYMLNIEGEN